MENNNHRPPENGGNNNKNQGPQSQFMVMLVAAIITLVAVYMMRNVMVTEGREEISYNQFVEEVNAGMVESVLVKSSVLDITYKDTINEKNPAKQYYVIRLSSDWDFSSRLLEHGVEIKQELQDSSVLLESILSFVIPFAIIVIFMNFMMKRMGGGIMGVGKSTAKMYMQKDTGITFSDVAGEDEAKESLVELVDFLQNPGKYTHIGARLPKGALLVGPPGTGKTLLARAVAGEAKVPFYFLSGSDFMEMYVGVGASRVRDLFKQAQQTSPCIIFIDEVDSIGRSRSNYGGGGESEQQQTLNQLLSEMDGVDSSKGLLILAATNRPEILDPALLRPGRFDRRIIVDKPDLKGRVEILKVHAKNVSLDDTVDLDAIALATSGAVGSDLANMINEAAILAVKHKRNAVSQKDLFEAVEVVLVGKEKKDRVLSKEERRIVSYHEVGHALLSALQKDAEPVQKITIVPRTMGALGYVMHVPEEEKYLNSQKEIKAMLVGYLGGRAAEEIVFQSVTTGAANDIEQATRLARAMVTQYGMSEKFGLMGLATQQDQYLTGRTVMNCGDATAAEVDNEIMRILKEAYEEAKRLLNENREVMDEIAEFLIEKETITGKEFMQIFRRCKGIPEPEEKKEEEKGKSPEEEGTGSQDADDGGSQGTPKGQDGQGTQGARDVREAQGIQGKRDNRNVQEKQDIQEKRDNQDIQGKQDIQENQDIYNNQENRENKENSSGWTEVK
ncbi:ATP-dependent metallopeptidase FtsH/Yme1/Tma family protein [Clostridiaceae bacterium]|nr:ATP-dependent metallopeptidase FtsH/Yme1/Tma family protein [Clostridiaceae bacterium]RKI12422.1 ATP-dependent metallopeptidase FtsH/Yme1/Tma family protein [bacterium 1XD21-70]